MTVPGWGRIAIVGPLLWGVLSRGFMSNAMKRGWGSRTRSPWRWLAIALLGLALAVVAVPARAQLGLPGATESDTGVPSNVQRYGALEVAWVESPLDGEKLFQVAAPTVRDRAAADAGVPVENRAALVEANLWRAVLRFVPYIERPEVMKVSVATLNGQPVIEVVATPEENARPLRLVTVTDLDADYQGLTQDEVARQWRALLEENVRQSLALLQPQALQAHLAAAGRALLGAALLSAAIALLQRILARRQQASAQRQVEAARAEVAATEESATADAPETTGEAIAGRRAQFLAELQQQLTRRRPGQRLLLWLLFWVQIALWYGTAFWCALQIPYLMRYRDQILGVPVELLLLWFSTSLAIRVTLAAIARVSRNWTESPLLSASDEQRRALRAATVAEALRGLAVCVWGAIAIVVALQLLGIPTGSVLAGSAIFGLAISFGTQNVVRDLVNGCLILAEDQFATGDVVEVNGQTGLVEHLNLRVTQLRDADGALITIPNSAFAQVRNLTRSWSRVNVAIEVAYDTDPERARAVIEATARELSEDPEWSEWILRAPQVLGIDSVSHAGLLFRVWIETAPLEQWSVGREFRYRLRAALERHQIQIGRPQWVTHALADSTNGAAEQAEAVER